ncbi:hypothetical protein [Haliea sp.]|uniref:hypothetical protein n=1 Tax=Haliea sp. TaxID=1932666 RepID=UPI000C43A8FE|nr:hypothetical protein [Haliea sp.]MAD65729.1 primosomal protein [Haliea sp.]
MKQILIETNIFKPTVSINEGKTSSDGNLLVQGILSTAEKQNGNGREYPMEILEREINKYMVVVKENRALGELDHPDSQVVNLKNVSHKINDMKFVGKKVMGTIEILPTPSGNILKALFASNVPVGISSRGMGSLKQVGEVMEVQDDFELLCYDFVSTPSNPGSYMSPLNESLTESNIYNKTNSIITDILCSNDRCPIY